LFQTAAGVNIPYSEKLEEKYQRDGNSFILNLSFEKLPDFIKTFYTNISEPLFLAVHPDAEANEVWYLDNMTKEQLAMILSGYGELLYQDGLSAFAVGSLKTEDEIYVEKYKVVSIYTSEPKRALSLFKRYGISQTSKLITAWDLFSEETPGSAQRLKIAGYTIPDMINELEKIGMYQEICKKTSD